MPVLAKDGFQLPQQVHYIYMGFMETSLMRQLGKLVEVVRHANEILGDGYRLCIVSADHLAVQGGLTDVLRQLAVGFSRPQPQCLVAWLRELFTVTDFDSLRTLPVGGLPPFFLSCSCMLVIRYTVYSWYTYFLRPPGAKFLRPHGGARRFGVPKT